MVDTLVEMGFAANVATQALLLCDLSAGFKGWIQFDDLEERTEIIHIYIHML